MRAEYNRHGKSTHPTSNLANILKKGTSMRIFVSIFTLVFAILLFATPSHAQKIELYGGYSFTHAPVKFLQTAALCPVPGCPTAATTQHLQLNGCGGYAPPQVMGRSTLS